MPIFSCHLKVPESGYRRLIKNQYFIPYWTTWKFSVSEHKDFYVICLDLIDSILMLIKPFPWEKLCLLYLHLLKVSLPWRLRMGIVLAACKFEIKSFNNHTRRLIYWNRRLSFFKYLQPSVLSAPLILHEKKKCVSLAEMSEKFSFLMPARFTHTKAFCVVLSFWHYH